MKAKKVPRLKRAMRWLNYRLAPHALILIYHRVADLPNDPHLLAVTPDHFADQMEVIRKYAIPLRLQDLVQALQVGKVPNRSVVVTFDDGYTDNLYIAKPILERYDVPATVFVTCGLVGSSREFWWDELEQVFLQPGTLPETLSLSFNGKSCTWQLDQAKTFTEVDHLRYRQWHVESPEDPSPRHLLFRMMYSWLSVLPSEERSKAMGDLSTWAGINTSCRPSHEALSSEGVIQLNQGGLVEVGAHTMTHPALADLSPEEQRAEIKQSKEGLESLLRHPVTSFAYPYGSYTPETVAILRESGFVCGCTSNSDAVWRGADVFQLPRVVVRDWDATNFTRWLKWWIDG